MSRYTGPKCRQCRREGMKLFLKGSRCETVKCAIAKRAHPPGEHPWARKKRSEYGVQLREKQKAKRTFGIFERPFRRLFAEAARSKGNTGEKLIQILERRLDNALYLIGFAHSRAHARQLITHGHVAVNGRRTKSPGFRLRQGDEFGIHKDHVKKQVEVTVEGTKHRDVPSWLSQDAKDLKGKVLNLPKRDEASVDLQEQLIVEFCSK
ncbi:MAG: 30S ribosomal protein S4 [Planctomycetes bacterium]|nr:30S ribosomal protein S4 [Planctomycetota bacterium]MCW8138919.1 30S ribosomal protein S4 [Planctomycetota bacterium]